MCVRNRDEISKETEDQAKEREREKRRKEAAAPINNKWLFSFHNIQGFEEFSCTDIILTNVHIDQTTAFRHFSHKEISFMKMQNKSFKGLLRGTGAEGETESSLSADQHVLNNCSECAGRAQVDGKG